MKIFDIEECNKLETSTPDILSLQNILTIEQEAKDLGGIFGLIGPSGQVPYHFHDKRESIIIVISGEAIEIIEGREITIKRGEVIFIPPGKKHMTINRTGRDFRYIEFFTYPPAKADFIEVE